MPDLRTDRSRFVDRAQEHPARKALTGRLSPVPTQSFPWYPFSVEATEAVSSNPDYRWDRPIGSMRVPEISSTSNLPNHRTLPKKGLEVWLTRMARTFRTTALFRRRDWQPGRLECLKPSEPPHSSEEKIGDLVGSKPGSSVVSVQELSEENSFLDTLGNPNEVGPDNNPHRDAS